MYNTKLCVWLYGIAASVEENQLKTFELTNTALLNIIIALLLKNLHCS